LTTVGVFRQGSYLSQGGLFDFASSEAEKWRAYRLVDPEGMGEELSVLIQLRGIRSPRGEEEPGQSRPRTS